ncbi:MAG TPA: FGGY family carbohydrate kinase [Armatimonadota bacterium]
MLLGIDAGTTHLKAGLFRLDGECVHVARRPTPTTWEPDGCSHHAPEAIWQAVADAIAEVMAHSDGEPVDAVGIAGMAETGLLMDRATGVPRCPFLPWFDSASAPQAGLLARADDPVERFLKAGMRPSPKVGLSKILQMKDRDARLLDGAAWLSVPSFIAWKLTGAFATDPSLAARTYAFRLDRREWDTDWIDSLGVSPALFPDILPSGQQAGRVSPAAEASTRVRAGTPVAVSGHDHVCAALAVGILHPGAVLDSMGTAETLVGAMAVRPLCPEDHASGLAFGCHVVLDRMFWMGGISSSGASVEWLRCQLDDRPMTYEALAALLEGLTPGPGDLLFFPYLRGSGAPWPDARMRGAFVGIDDSHTRAHLFRAVLEGTAYEVEAMRRSAETAMGASTSRVSVVGGGAMNAAWMQIKADVAGCALDVPALNEAAALGAALCAAIGQGIYASADAAAAAVARAGVAYAPDPHRHPAYRRVLQDAYIPMHAGLRDHFARMTEALRIAA